MLFRRCLDSGCFKLATKAALARHPASWQFATHRLISRVLIIFSQQQRASAIAVSSSASFRECMPQQIEAPNSVKAAVATRSAHTNPKAPASTMVSPVANEAAAAAGSAMACAADRLHLRQDATAASAAAAIIRAHTTAAASGAAAAGAAAATGRSSAKERPAAQTPANKRQRPAPKQTTLTGKPPRAAVTAKAKPAKASGRSGSAATQARTPAADGAEGCTDLGEGASVAYRPRAWPAAERSDLRQRLQVCYVVNNHSPPLPVECALSAPETLPKPRHSLTARAQRGPRACLAAKQTRPHKMNLPCSFVPGGDSRL